MYFEKRKRENRDKLVSNVCNLPNYLGKLFMMVILHFMIYQIFKNTKNLLSDYVNRLCKLYVTLKFYILDSVLSKSGIFQIKNKFLAANYPQKFLKKFIRNFENDKVESFKHYCRNFHQDFLILLSTLFLYLFVLKMRFVQNNLFKSFITSQEVILTYGLKR